MPTTWLAGQVTVAWHERGRAIARVVPVSGERTIDKLIRDGLVTPAQQRTRRRPKLLVSAGTVSDLLAEQRW